jgi:hypothetical protein
MSFSKQSGLKNVHFKNLAFLICLDDLQFKCIFHKQSGSESGSESNLKAGSKAGPESGLEKNKKSDPQH